MSEHENERAVIAGVIVGAWRDDSFRTRLLDDPVRVLEEAGLVLPADCRVTVLEDTPTVRHVAIPRLEELVAGERERLMAELATVIPLPAGVELRLRQNTATERFVVLPLPHPEAARLGDAALKTVVGGGFPASFGSGGDGGAGGIVGSGGNGGNGGAGGTGTWPC
jgi:uncharacterized membrane protein YgcG